MRIDSIKVRIEHDEDPDLSWLEQDCFADDNYGPERIAAIQRGEWSMVGIIVEAVVSWDDVWSADGQTCLAAGGTEGIDQSVWGVESDADLAYVQELGENLVSDLRWTMEHDPRFAPLSDFPDEMVDWSAIFGTDVVR